MIESTRSMPGRKRVVNHLVVFLAILTECHSLNPARVGQVADATRQAVKSQ